MALNRLLLVFVLLLSVAGDSAFCQPLGTLVGNVIEQTLCPSGKLTRTAGSSDNLLEGTLSPEFTVHLKDIKKTTDHVGFSVNLRVVIKGDAPLEADEEESFWLEGSSFLGTNSIRFRFLTVWDYEIGAIDNSMEVMPSIEKGAAPKKDLGIGNEFFAVIPSVTVVLIPKGKKIRKPRPSISDMELHRKNGSFVFTFSDLEGTCAETSTSYEYSVKRSGFFRSPVIAQGTVSSDDGNVRIVTSADSEWKEETKYVVSIRLRRTGPSFDTSWSARSSKTVVVSLNESSDSFSDPYGELNRTH